MQMICTLTEASVKLVRRISFSEFIQELTNVFPEVSYSSSCFQTVLVGGDGEWAVLKQM